ncbi:MAG: FliO/MopB family protein [Vicinamibacterales bacterium]
MSDLRGLLALAIVIALLTGVLWLLRRGVAGRRAAGPLRVETALSLGERRTLVIVGVEGRRLLLGVTPASVALVAELDRGDAFDRALAGRAADPAGPAA